MPRSRGRTGMCLRMGAPEACWEVMALNDSLGVEEGSFIHRMVCWMSLKQQRILSRKKEKKKNSTGISLADPFLTSPPWFQETIKLIPARKICHVSVTWCIVEMMAPSSFQRLHRSKEMRENADEISNQTAISMHASHWLLLFVGCDAHVCLCSLYARPWCSVAPAR